MTEIPITIKTTEHVRFDGEFCDDNCYYLSNDYCFRYKENRYEWSTRLIEGIINGDHRAFRCKKCLKRFGDGNESI